MTVCTFVLYFGRNSRPLFFMINKTLLKLFFFKFIPDLNEPNSLIRSASDSQNDTSLSEMDILIRKMADELHIDAERAIEGLKKDKELWDRLQHVKKSDGHADQENHNGLFTTFIFRLGSFFICSQIAREQFSVTQKEHYC